MDRNGLALNFNEPKRVNIISKACIDNIATSKNCNITVKEKLDLGLCDQRALFVNLQVKDKLLLSNSFTFLKINFSEKTITEFINNMTFYFFYSS